tara:strand:- start:1237 stop:1656 length:420 start_codon:yes stop_codon:yes gene_type:complete
VGDKQMNNDNENVDWDKVNRGKVRYGFALELYKKSGKLTKTKIGEIEAFVDYVMLGIDVIDNDKKVGKDRLMTIDECKKVFNNKHALPDDYVRATIHAECQDLKDEDVKSIMTAFNAGKITMSNLDACVDRIVEMKSKK